MSPERIGNPTGAGGGPRGKVKGWSVASRRRMRLFMLTRSLRPGFLVGGATFTVPGPVQSPEWYRALFSDWARSADKLGWAAVWRMEVQKRGAVHWHLLCGVPCPLHGATCEGGPECRDMAGIRVRGSWMDALDRRGVVDYGGEVFLPGPRVRARSGSLSLLPGAEEHAAEADFDVPPSGAWKRYLQDHATKRKQEQIGEGIGRHWGVIGRKCFEQVLPEVREMSPKDYARVRRWYERLATPSRPAACVFGRKLGWRLRRGRWGTAACFCQPATVRRMVDYALSEERPTEAPTIAPGR